ncbi:hypothetical protein PLESTB_000183400 [Pleodorina starrii]|uniref:DIRP domain-containing protein n=1 Tax=Pleodorina starrii TaxID=330485 RepID=A0A9W6EY46_9CHLO|nr:hypothetical protein PLESTB_000183400 [Pleodorina starrii]GLC66096.1 hypothetical protein PLESTF_000384300 [Pleodorina starrii]
MERGIPGAVKLEDDVLRKFYRSFHKHGAVSWAKVSKDTKLSVEQCEMLHKQHMSFLSLPASPALETAFLAMVDDHYNATQKLVKEELQDDDMIRGGRPRRGELEEAEAQVATSSSQKPRRTPKPTPQRLAAEEEQQARRLAKANQVTPKSARTKAMAKAPPSPPPGEWNSSQRKRSRRLFEDSGEQEAPRYRSPIIDRWRGRHNTDVDEGVDALLSLASGAHASSALDDHAAGADMASNAVGQDFEVPEPEPEPVQETPKRARGVRGARATPTPSGTPQKVGARASSAAATADTAPLPNATGLRSPRARGGASSAAVASAAAPHAPPAATTPGRGGTTSGGKPKKETLGSPTSSQQRGGAAAGGASTPVATDAGGDAGISAPPGSEAANGGTPDGAVASGVPTSPGPSGRPVRKRKPTAIALAAAAAADEEDGGGGRGVRSVVAAVAAAVAAAEASQAADKAAATAPDSAAASPPDGSGSNHVADTAALLASVPPVRTRGSVRLASSGPGSRRAAELNSPPPASISAPGDAVGADAASEDAEAAPVAAVEPATAAEASAPGAGRAKVGTAAGLSQAAAHGPVPPSVRFGPARVATQPPPGRTRRRKSPPERIPPLWESLKVTGPAAATLDGVPLAAGDVRMAGADGTGAGPSDAGAHPPAGAGESSTAMPAAEIALRHCLGPRTRRWCMYEFLYSALDRPWFLRNELLEFCALHMQLPTTKLTRLEWSVLRSALGRPRRLSLAFLREERLRLEGYREHARLKYEEVALGMEVSHELPRQLRVGQEVTARHPYSRQLYDGVILTVKGNKYRVQFHRGDLMTEVIRDTDVMPVDPHECMPLHMAVVPFLLNGRIYDPARLASLRGLLPPAGMGLRPPTLGMRPLGSWAYGMDSQMMREQEAAMVAEVQRALEVKEELVAQLTQLNNEAASGLHTDENGGRTDNFQLKYTNVVLKLRDTNAVLEAALGRLQNRQQQIQAAPPATFGPALALQQQQLAAAAAAAAGGGVGMRPSGSGAALSQQPAAAQQQQQQALQQSAPQTPPAQAQQQPPLPVPAPSPTAPPAVAQAPAPAALGQQQVRPGDTKPAVQMQPPAPSPDAPLVVPPPRSSAASASAAAPLLAQAPAGFPTPGQVAHSLAFGMLLSTPDQLVEQALAEARTVVDGCRGKLSDGQPLLLPPGPQPVPVVAPIVLQAPGGASVPLVLPPGAVLPQQLMLQRHVGVDGQPQEQAPAALAAAVGHPSHATPAADGDGSSDGRDAGSLADGGSAGGLRDASAEPTEPSGTATSICVKTEEEDSTGRRGSEAAGTTGRTGPAEVVPSGRQQRSAENSMTEEELAESWLRDVIVGCVGVLFTIQKCTAGNVPAATVAEALDLAVQQLQIRTDGENDALYGDIVQSVQGLKGHLTRAFA